MRRPLHRRGARPVGPGQLELVAGFAEEDEDDEEVDGVEDEPDEDEPESDPFDEPDPPEAAGAAGVVEDDPASEEVVVERLSLR